MKNKYLKKLIPVAICIALMGSVQVFADAPQMLYYDGAWHQYTEGVVSVKVNGEGVVSDVPPIILGNYTLVPARAIFEKMGAEVLWNEAESKVTVKLGSDVIELKVNSNIANVNGKQLTMPMPAKVVNNRTLIPVRFVAESLGMLVDWDDATRTVSIKRQAKVTNVTTAVDSNIFRITVEGDGDLSSYSAFTLENNDRIVVDISNTTLLSDDMKVQVAPNDTVTAVRLGQNYQKPSIARIVADVANKGRYTVKLSDDKKKLFIDVECGPAIVSAPKVNYGIDSMEVILPIDKTRSAYTYSVGERGQYYIEIPKAAFKDIPSSILPTTSELVKAVNFSNVDDKARLTIQHSKPVLTQVINESGSLRIVFMSAKAAKVEYSYDKVPKISFVNSVTSQNYFRYVTRKEGNSLVLRVFDSLGYKPNTKLFINDGVFNALSFVSAGEYAMDYYFEPTNKTEFNVDSVSKADTLSVYPFIPKTVLGKDIPITATMKKKIVVIDPGHGGSDPGAVVKDRYGKDIYEKTLNLDISFRVAELLKKAEIGYIMTRIDDSFVGLYERTDLANNRGASLFVSVHNNYLPSEMGGTMTFFYPSPLNPQYGVTSERVAQMAQEELVSKLGSDNLGVWKRPMLAVLNSAKMPSILAEIGVMNNIKDRDNLLDAFYRQKSAEALYKSIIRTLYEMETIQ